jgi:hypothetical protein
MNREWVFVVDIMTNQEDWDYLGLARRSKIEKYKLLPELHEGLKASEREVQPVVVGTG